MASTRRATAADTPPVASGWRNRIEGYGEEAPGDLLANPRNWRLHPKTQQDALGEVLAEVGWVTDVIVNKRTGFVLDGHLRVELAISKGEAMVPVKYVDLSEAEEALILLTFDPIAGMAAAAKDNLADLLADVGTREGGIGDLLADLRDKAGMGREAGADPGADPAAGEELQAKWKTERGQVWTVGSHRLMCGDSTDGGDVSRLVNGEPVGIMVTDPPYGVGYSPQWRRESGVSDSDQVDELQGDDRASWSTSFIHFTGPVAYVWHGARVSAIVERSLKIAGFDVRAEIIWVKNRFAISRGNYHWRHEPCLYAVRKGASAAWIGGRKQSTVWADLVDVMSPDRDDAFAFKVDDDTVYAFDGSATTVWDISLETFIGGGHSTQKPVECMARPIRNHEGDVYDPFMGTGPTLVACEQLGRRGYGMEIEPKYVAVSLERLAGMGLTPKLEA